jgi:hypothetical protein
VTPEEIAAMKAENEKIKADHAKALKDHADEISKLKPAPKKDDDDPSLADKVRKDTEEKEKAAKHEKSLESALNFNIESKSFVKNNAGLLPPNIQGLFDQAEKENYATAIEKASAVKVGIVSEFFAVQANLDLLTSGQKVELDQFLKLTKNVKQERVEGIYSMIFEPTLETLRKVEKAKQLNNGVKNQSDSEKELADRMMKKSRKHYLGEKA